jgi:hypothetical protein
MTRGRKIAAHRTVNRMTVVPLKDRDGRRAVSPNKSADRHWNAVVFRNEVIHDFFTFRNILEPEKSRWNPGVFGEKFLV